MKASCNANLGNDSNLVTCRERGAREVASKPSSIKLFKVCHNMWEVAAYFSGLSVAYIVLFLGQYEPFPETIYFNPTCGLFFEINLVLYHVSHCVFTYLSHWTWSSNCHYFKHGHLFTVLVFCPPVCINKKLNL